MWHLQWVYKMYESLPGGEGLVESMAWGWEDAGWYILGRENASAKAKKYKSLQGVDNGLAAC